jgi:hypothetical protein
MGITPNIFLIKIAFFAIVNSGISALLCAKNTFAKLATEASAKIAPQIEYKDKEPV